MKTKEEFMDELRRRERSRLSYHDTSARYFLGCVEIMFELAAETLAEVRQASETASESPDQKKL